MLGNDPNNTAARLICLTAENLLSPSALLQNLNTTVDCVSFLHLILCFLFSHVSQTSLLESAITPRSLRHTVHQVLERTQ